MTVQIQEEPLAALAELAKVSIGFEVDRVLDVVPREGGLAGLALVERRLETPYVKDYDALEPPSEWGKRFDLSHWGVILARSDGRCVGGAVVAFDTQDVEMLEDRRDLAVLWDLRVLPGLRGLGIGRALFQAAEAWAAARGCRELKVETQNVNVPACRFYARQGCVLGAIHRFAYPDLPDEAQLLWYEELGKRRP